MPREKTLTTGDDKAIADVVNLLQGARGPSYGNNVARLIQAQEKLNALVANLLMREV
jgi:hypothetical protein